jgi:CubicO group peptidase (beta-lactamase class C family)
MAQRFEAVERLLAAGVAERSFPAASAEVGSHDIPIWRYAAGRLTYEPDAEPATADTIFDLASLTKVIATTTLLMRAVDDHLLVLDDCVADWLPEWRGADRHEVTVRDLLAHASGLPAYLPFYRDLTGRVEFEPAICHTPLEYAPRAQSVYSDLGFMLLAFILENARPGVGFAQQFRSVASFVTSDPLMFSPARSLRSRIAPTEIEEWRGRLLAGEVHDENAWALGGAAGHAGLFGTAEAVGAFARAALRTIAGERILAEPSTFRAFIQRTTVPGSSRALGWDTMRPTSSCGTRLSPTAIGHTGFTGTSLWIDWERDLYMVLLTNRVHPTRENERQRAIRPVFHDAVVAAVTGE